MNPDRRTWLIYNETSGSNDEAALAAVIACLEAAGFALERRICFPDEAAPPAAELRSRSVATLVVFAGDGTIHSVVTGLYGWEGHILVLPGGTMNLLSRRLHGEAEPAEIIARAGHGEARCLRPSIVRTAHGDALTGVLAGPGTYWNEVREAMREGDVLEMVSEGTQAVSESTRGAMVAFREPARGKSDGYSAILVSPGPDGLIGDGYFADTLFDYARFAIAFLRRDFREGPHDRFELGQRVRIACAVGEPMGMLIDGEPFDGQPEETFVLARCGVDLIATASDG